MRNSRLFVIQMILFAAYGHLFADELADVYTTDNGYLVVNETIEVEEVYLNKFAGDGSQQFVQQGGLVDVQRLRIDNGAYDIAGGVLNADYLAIGDPTTQRIQATNIGSVAITAIEPVTTQRLDFQSKQGLLVPVADSGMFSPFNTISSNTPSRITLESIDQPAVLEGFVSLPIGYNGWEVGDLMITLGEQNNTTLEAEFVQTGGIVNVSDSLELCVPPATVISVIDTSQGRYERMGYKLDGGELNIGGDLVVGNMGAAPTTFIQSAGSSRVDGTVRVDGSNSIVNLQNGTFEVNNFRVGTSDFSNGGRLELNAEATMVVTGELAFGFNADFVTHGSPTIYLDSAEFSLMVAEDVDMPGLIGLNLVVQGDSDQTTKLEAFHWDGGAEVDASTFQMGHLQIGGEMPASVQLVNEFGNNWTDENAMYVDTLTLSPGSELDLNRINLYYQELVLGEGAEILNYSVNCDGEYGVTPGDLSCLRPENRDYLLGQLGIHAGDVDADGQVDFADFLVLSENFGLANVGYQLGDFDMDGTVGFPDFLELSANWGSTGTRWTDQGEWFSSVPESSSNLLMLFGLPAIGLVRRKSQHHR